jgi:hypothetical protein
MYDYDRRTAAHPRSYVEVVDSAIKTYGIKQGHERKVNEAKRIARELDRELKHHNSLSDDDDWARGDKHLKLWAELQKLFYYCFGFDPPALGKI